MNDNEISGNSYGYSKRKRVQPISWEDFHGICNALAIAASRFEPEVILPVGRGGYYPGTLLAHMLQVEVWPVRLSRRVNDIVKHEVPRWMLEPPAEIAGHRVLVEPHLYIPATAIRLAKG